jgi:hypothetical protein
LLYHRMCGDHRRTDIVLKSKSSITDDSRRHNPSFIPGHINNVVEFVLSFFSFFLPFMEVRFRL